MTAQTAWFDDAPLDFGRDETRRALTTLVQLYPTLEEAVLDVGFEPSFRSGRLEDDLRALMVEAKTRGVLVAWLQRAPRRLHQLLPDPDPDRPAVSSLQDGVRVAIDGRWTARDFERVLRAFADIYASHAALAGRSADPLERNRTADHALQIHRLQYGSPGVIEIGAVGAGLTGFTKVIIDVLKLTLDRRESPSRVKLQDAERTKLELEIRRQEAAMVEASLGRDGGSDSEDEEAWERLLAGIRAIGALASDRKLVRVDSVAKATVVASSDWTWNRGEDHFGAYVDAFVGPIRLRMRWLPPGTFVMGTADDDPDVNDREWPAHAVTLTRGFWLAETPCTQGLYQAIAGDNPSYFVGDDRPVERVTADDADQFIRRLNRQLVGARFSLPTEAQWEYACRAGTTASRYHCDVDAIAWSKENSDGRTHPVRQKLPNAFGLHDTLGNVYEWTQDSRGRYPSAPRTDPVPHSAGYWRACRGGSWWTPATSCRAARRFFFDPSRRLNDVGFRLCIQDGELTV